MMQFIVRDGILLVFKSHKCSCLLGFDSFCSHQRALVRAVDLLLNGHHFVIAEGVLDVTTTFANAPLVQLHLLGGDTPKAPVYNLPVSVAALEISDYDTRLAALTAHVTHPLVCGVPKCVKASFAYHVAGTLVNHYVKDHSVQELAALPTLPASLVDAIKATPVGQHISKATKALFKAFIVSTRPAAE